ncbi:hypothetical protein NZK35_03180, partial [Stieleria sp. ICT_E10.1]|uniref:hypothetical protein n=1 Tax=Stieleria sedimenti TaxID=2976331 RepID=UPI0021804F58
RCSAASGNASRLDTSALCSHTLTCGIALAGIEEAHPRDNRPPGTRLFIGIRFAEDLIAR